MTRHLALEITYDPGTRRYAVADNLTSAEGFGSTGADAIREWALDLWSRHIWLSEREESLSVGEREQLDDMRIVLDFTVHATGATT